MPNMMFLDRRLQDWRIRMAKRWLRYGDRVLDVGCADGTLFRRVSWLQDGVGIDPTVENERSHGSHRLVRGRFPDDLDTGRPFDAIVALAVFEHVPEGESGRFADGCRRLLRPGGRVVMTVPSPVVDRILHLLMHMRLVAGMEAHQHWGLRPSHVPAIFEAYGLRLEHHRRFELGVNHLFVFSLGDS